MAFWRSEIEPSFWVFFFWNSVLYGVNFPSSLKKLLFEIGNGKAMCILWSVAVVKLCVQFPFKRMKLVLLCTFQSTDLIFIFRVGSNSSFHPIRYAFCRFRISCLDSIRSNLIIILLKGRHSLQAYNTHEITETNSMNFKLVYITQYNMQQSIADNW